MDEDYDYVIYIWRCNHRESEDGHNGEDLEEVPAADKTTKTFTNENNNNNENNNSEDHDEVPSGDEGSTTHAIRAASHYSDDPVE